MFTVLVAEAAHPRQSGIFETLSIHFQRDITIYKAENASDLLRYLESQNTDILLLDISLPGLHAEDSSLLRQALKTQCIILPIVDLEHFEPHSFPNELTVLDYLLMPCTESELIVTLEEALHQCKNQQDHLSADASANQGELTRMDVIRRRIQQYIVNHYSEIISMQDVARAMNYSDTHFCRLFKQCFQVNFSVYLNEFRIQQASKILMGTNQTIKEIGAACGYRDTSYFIRVFKRHTGMTPSDYRIHKLTMTAKKSNNS